MKVLDTAEIESVAGGNLFSDIGHAIGYAVGWAAHRIADAESNPNFHYHSAG